MLHYPSASVSIPKIVGFLAVASWLLAAATGRVPTALRAADRLGLCIPVGSRDLADAVPGPGVGRQPDDLLRAVRRVPCPIRAADSGRREGQALPRRLRGLHRDGGRVRAVQVHHGQLHLASGPIGDPNDFAMFLSGAIPLAVFFAFNAQSRRRLWRSRSSSSSPRTWRRSRGVRSSVLARCCSGRSSRAASRCREYLAEQSWWRRYLPSPSFCSSRLSRSAWFRSRVAANQNVASREVFWQAAWHMALDHPVVGVGPDRFGLESEHYVRNDPIVLQRSGRAQQLPRDSRRGRAVRSGAVPVPDGVYVAGASLREAKGRSRPTMWSVVALLTH